MRGLAHKRIQSYLIGKKQFVSVTGTYSMTLDMKFRVPQGSILDPVLLSRSSTIVHINDIPETTSFAKFIMRMMLKYSANSRYN